MEREREPGASPPECSERAELSAERSKFVDLYQRAVLQLQEIVRGNVPGDAESVLEVVWYLRAYAHEAHKKFKAHCQQHGC